MGMGFIAYGDVLVDALGMGNELGGLVAGGDLLADAGTGGTRRTVALDCIGHALGSSRADQHFADLVSSSVRIVGVVSAKDSGQAIVCRHGIGCGVLRRNRRAV